MIDSIKKKMKYKRINELKPVDLFWYAVIRVESFLWIGADSYLVFWLVCLLPVDPEVVVKTRKQSSVTIFMQLFKLNQKKTKRTEDSQSKLHII